MHRVYFFALIILIFIGCQPKLSYPTKKYPKNLGEIEFDKKLDDANFILCDTSILIQSRLALSYQGGFERIEEIYDIYAKDNGEDYTGFILVRFIINCNNETGRFRFQTLDDRFLHQECPQVLIDNVEKCVQKLDEWIVLKSENKGKDHSHYLNFKIVNGDIKSIIH